VHRILVPAGVMIGPLLVASPAQAYGHGSTHNPYPHAVLDVLTLLVVASPTIALAVTAGAIGAVRRTADPATVSAAG
jgi:hypothetical protein